MKLAYGNPDNTNIIVTLDEGESLGYMHGSGVFHVPIDPTNMDYAAITMSDYPIEPYSAGVTSLESRDGA
jgi:hypothetical protein